MISQACAYLSLASSGGMEEVAVLAEIVIRAERPLSRRQVGRYLRVVWTLVWTFLGAARSSLKTQRELAFENLALRQQIGVLTRTLGDRRLRLGVWDRGFWVVVSQGWAGWKEALAIVQPATVIRWHRDGFRRFWTRRSRKQRLGRPRLDREIVSLIRRMSQANVTWGSAHP